jgi:hypothetical protein
MWCVFLTICYSGLIQQLACVDDIDLVHFCFERVSQSSTDVLLACSTVIFQFCRAIIYVINHLTVCMWKGTENVIDMCSDM